MKIKMKTCTKQALYDLKICRVRYACFTKKTSNY